MFKLLLILFITLNTYANEDFNEEVSEIYEETKLMENLNQIREENLEYSPFDDIFNSGRYSISDVEILKLKLEHIVQSPLKTYHLPRGSLLVELKTDRFFYTTKNATVRAYTQEEFEKFRYILSKDGKIKYKVRSNNLVNIDSVSEIKPVPKKYEPNKSYEDRAFYNPKLETSFYAKIATGAHFPKFALALIGGDQHMSGITKIEAQKIYESKFKHNFGVNIAYEMISGQNEVSSYQYSSILLGPTYFYTLFDDTYLTFQTAFSIYSDITTETPTEENRYLLSSTQLELGFNTQILEKEKNIFIGASVQRKWMRAKALRRSLSSNSVTYDDSILFHISHRTSFLW